jgi:hypothetical protein
MQKNSGGERNGIKSTNSSGRHREEDVWSRKIELQHKEEADLRKEFLCQVQTNRDMPRKRQIVNGIREFMIYITTSGA